MVEMDKMEILEMMKNSGLIITILILCVCSSWFICMCLLCLLCFPEELQHTVPHKKLHGIRSFN